VIIKKSYKILQKTKLCKTYEKVKTLQVSYEYLTKT